MTSPAAALSAHTGDVLNGVNSLTGLNGWGVRDVRDVALPAGYRYNGAMPRQKNPDELTASAAIDVLGTYRQHFYDLVRAGRIKQHYRRSAGKRAFYLREEVLALKAQLDAEDAGEGQQG